MQGPRENIQITLVLDILDGINIESKSYGPFKVSVPQSSLKDMCKFMVFTLLENKFTLLSAQEIGKIGCKIMTHNKLLIISY